MKYLIASDIHGSAFYCKKLLDLYEKTQCQTLILLGDLLYHGPRNELPLEYNPKEVLTMLNDFAKTNRILCVRGNCDAEVDQMVLEFPIMATYAVLDLAGHFTFLTHGHIYGEDNPVRLKKGDILIQGHTHIQRKIQKDGILFLNPGSTSLPKGDGYNGCLIFEKTKDLEDKEIGIFKFMDLNGKEIDFIKTDTLEQ